jgi:hypothetical protein
MNTGSKEAMHPQTPPGNICTSVTLTVTGYSPGVKMVTAIDWSPHPPQSNSGYYHGLATVGLRLSIDGQQKSNTYILPDELKGSVSFVPNDNKMEEFF